MAFGFQGIRRNTVAGQPMGVDNDPMEVVGYTPGGTPIKQRRSSIKRMKEGRGPTQPKRQVGSSFQRALEGDIASQEGALTRDQGRKDAAISEQEQINAGIGGGLDAGFQPGIDRMGALDKDLVGRRDAAVGDVERSSREGLRGFDRDVRTFDKQARAAVGTAGAAVGTAERGIQEAGQRRDDAISAGVSALERRVDNTLNMVESGLDPATGRMLSQAERQAMRRDMEFDVRQQSSELAGTLRVQFAEITDRAIGRKADAQMQKAGVEANLASTRLRAGETRAGLVQSNADRMLNARALSAQYDRARADLEQVRSGTEQALEMAKLNARASGNDALFRMLDGNPTSVVSRFAAYASLASMLSAPGLEGLNIEETEDFNPRSPGMQGGRR